MCTFFSGPNHHPTRKYDGIPYQGPLGPPAGPYPCCTSFLLATLGLGCPSVCSPVESGTTGGDMLLQTISR